MAILARNRRVFDERLPDGRSVDDAVRDLSRRPAQDDDAGSVGIIMGTGANAGRGFEMIPRNPDNPYESPQQTKRGFELRDTLRHGGVPEDYRDPTAAQFPVNALGTPVNDGYGAGYNKSALDRGYAPPIRTVAPAVDEPMLAERDVYAGARNPAVPQLADLPAPPTMIQRNNKGRPVAVIGGDDPITANRALIREQEGYKAPRSTKDQILSILQGGIGAGIDYATNQNTRNRWAVGEDVAREEGQIGRELALRKSENELLNDQSQRDYRDAETGHLAQEPARLRAISQEQERDNLRQLYNSLPDFDRKNPQHKAIADRAAALGLVLPDREAKDETTIEKINGQLLAVNRKTRTATPVTRDGQPLVNQADVPTKVTIDGQEFTVSQAQGVNALATRGQRDYQRDKDAQELERKDLEREGKAESFRQQSASARSLGDELDGQLRAPTTGLYAQRAAIQTALGREGEVTTPEQKVAHNTRMSQLSALNSRIAQIEQGRNLHYANADKLRGQAAEFNPLPVTRGQRGGRGGKYVAPKVSADRLRELMQ